MPEIPTNSEIDEIQGFFKKAKALRKNSQNEEAILCYDKILETNPNNIIAMYEKVHCNFALARWEETSRCVNAIHRLEPNNAFYLLNRARVLLDVHKVDEALEYFDKVATIWPGDSDIWNSKGILLLELGKVDNAFECFKQAISLLPDIDNFNSDYLENARHQKALECLEKLIQTHSTSERLLNEAEAAKKHIENRRELMNRCAESQYASIDNLKAHNRFDLGDDHPYSSTDRRVD
jgi:tetratricopeptide (TPR) repeat protein